ncbi:hypothetical protein AAMO2058_000087300 [Amorphochlora amoebiformis]
MHHYRFKFPGKNEVCGESEMSNLRRAKLYLGPKAHLEVEGKSFPPNVCSWYYPRERGGWIATVHEFIIWHYFFWWLIALLFFLTLQVLNIISGFTNLVIFSVYMLQLLFYKPQRGRGWDPVWKWTMYSGFFDLSLSYSDGWLVREAPLDPEKQYVFGWAPHGILGLCRMGSAGSWWKEAFPHHVARWGSFSMAFFIPGVREFSLFAGATDASRSVLIGRAKDNESIHLIPGGIREMMLTDGDSDVTQVVMKGRFGFVRIAWEYGLDLIPVYCFGEKWTSKRVDLPYALKKMNELLGMAGTVCTSRFGTLLPYQTHPRNGKLGMGWVFGKPIPVKKRHVEDLKDKEVKQVENAFQFIDTKRDEILDERELKVASTHRREGNNTEILPFSLRYLVKRAGKLAQKDPAAGITRDEFMDWWKGEIAIRKLHRQFLHEMHRIFETYKSQFGYGEYEKLEFVDPSKSDFKQDFRRPSEYPVDLKPSSTLRLQRLIEDQHYYFRPTRRPSDMDFTSFKTSEAYSKRLTEPSNISKSRVVSPYVPLSDTFDLAIRMTSYEGKAPPLALRPKLVVFDLDNCMWTPELYELYNAPTPDVDIELFEGAKVAMHELATDKSWKGSLVACASRTDEVQWAEKLITQFEVAKGVTMADLFSFTEIFPSSKLRHFRNLTKDSGIKYEDMMFFDDCTFNTVEIEKLGVLCIHVPYGLTKEMWRFGVREYARRKLNNVDSKSLPPSLHPSLPLSLPPSLPSSLPLSLSLFPTLSFSLSLSRSVFLSRYFSPSPSLPRPLFHSLPTSLSRPPLPLHFPYPNPKPGQWSSD